MNMQHNELMEKVNVSRVLFINLKNENITTDVLLRICMC